MSIALEIRSVSLPIRQDYMDLYRPRLLVYDSDESSGDVEHVDVVITWKGLEKEQADEICFWEQATRAALESHVEEMLISSFVHEHQNAGKQHKFSKPMLKSSGELPDLDTLKQMRDFVNAQGCCTFLLPVRRLVDFMLSYHDSFGHGFSWLFDDSDPVFAVTNFLRNLDFFEQMDTDGCRICIDLDAKVEHSSAGIMESEYTLKITATTVSPLHKIELSLASRAMPKPVFIEPLLDYEIPLEPLHVQLTELSWNGRNTSVIVAKRFPKNIKMERHIRLQVGGAFLERLQDSGIVARSPRLSQRPARGTEDTRWSMRICKPSAKRLENRKNRQVRTIETGAPPTA
jgi:hypothetical protein